MDGLRSAAALVGAALCAGLAAAQADPQAYSATSETTTRYNVNSSTTIGGPQATAYANVFVAHDGGSQFRLNTLTVGIRRVGTAAAPAPPVGVEVSVVEMTAAGGLGDVVATFTQDLALTTATATVPVSFTWGATDPSVRPVIDLQNGPNGVNGYGGFWVGVKFTGADAVNNLNGWRVVNEPAPGRTPNSFGVFNAATGTFGVYWFGQTAGTDGVLRDNPARFQVQANGAAVDPVAPPADRVYGQSFEHTSYFKPPDALDGVGSRWVYTNCFVPAAAGDVLVPNKIVYGIYRAGTATTPAPAAGVELALVEMTYDGTAYNFGQTVASKVFQLDATTTAGTTRLEWTWTNPADRPTVPLNTANPANAGVGGYFVAARMLGDAATLAGNQGPRIVYAPLVGASWLGMGMLSDTGVFTIYNFGTYSNSSTTLYLPKPARFLSETFGAIGPKSPSACPSDLDGDGNVTAADLATLLGAWASPGGDLNVDGTTTAADLSILLGAWGPCP
ncbi:MAG: hypothetical protein ACKOYN_01245 [Planctomycetota bacterium]